MAYRDRTIGFGGMLTPVVKRLLIANVAVFLVTLPFMDFAIDWFAFRPAKIFIRPWGVFTYMFIHQGFMHVALNMLVLFFFGPPLESRWGGREFLKYYVICGLGAVVLGFFYLPGAVVGASGAVFGLMLAFAMNWPDAPIYVWGIFPVKAKWLVAFLFIISLMNMLTPSGSGIAHFAHLGGLVTGYIYLRGRWGARSGAQKLSRVVRSRRLAIVPRDEGDATVPSARSMENNEEKVLYDRVDEVLDKISAKGMASLTPDELKLLDDVSRRHPAN